MRISMQELRNKIQSLSNDKVVSCYKKLKNCMAVNPQLCKSGDLYMFNLLRSEIVERQIEVD